MRTEQVGLLDYLWGAFLLVFVPGYYLLMFLLVIGMIFIATVLVRIRAVFLLIVTVIAILGIIWGFIKSFSKVPVEGIKMDKVKAPKLFKVLEEVTKKLDTRMPDDVRLVAGPEISVLNEFQLKKPLFQRRLVIGMACMRKLSIKELRAILAHEFGHFSHHDTFFGRIVGHAFRGLSEQLKNIAATGLNLVTLIPFFILLAYVYIFRFFYAGFSRRREFLADNVAVKFAGGNVFSSALVKYSKYAFIFNNVVPKYIINAATQKKIFKNIYEWFETGYTKVDEKKLEDELFKAKTGFFSTHPALKTRIRRAGVKQLTSVSGKSALTLLKDVKELEKVCTEYLTVMWAVRAGLARMVSGKFIWN